MPHRHFWYLSLRIMIYCNPHQLRIFLLPRIKRYRFLIMVRSQFYESRVSPSSLSHRIKHHSHTKHPRSTPSCRSLQQQLNFRALSVTSPPDHAKCNSGRLGPNSCLVVRGSIFLVHCGGGRCRCTRAGSCCVRRCCLQVWPPRYLCLLWQPSR